MMERKHKEEMQAVRISYALEMKVRRFENMRGGLKVLEYV